MKRENPDIPEVMHELHNSLMTLKIALRSARHAAEESARIEAIDAADEDLRAIQEQLETLSSLLGGGAEVV